MINFEWKAALEQIILATIEENNLSIIGECVFEESTEKRFFQCFDVKDKDTGLYTQLLFVVNKETGHITHYNYF